MPNIMESQGGKVVHELTKDDVLLGRGTGSNENSGNVRFRRVLRDVLQKEYFDKEEKEKDNWKNNTAYLPRLGMDPEKKDRIARRVVDVIKARNGRFVQKMSKPEAKLWRKTKQLASLPEAADLYRVVNEEEAVKKARAAIRFQLKKQSDSGGGSTSHDGDQINSTIGPLSRPRNAAIEGETSVMSSSTAAEAAIAVPTALLAGAVAGASNKAISDQGNAILSSITGTRNSLTTQILPHPPFSADPGSSSTIAESHSNFFAQQQQHLLASLALANNNAVGGNESSALMSLLRNPLGSNVISSALPQNLTRILDDLLQRELVARSLLSQQSMLAALLSSPSTTSSAYNPLLQNSATTLDSSTLAPELLSLLLQQQRTAGTALAAPTRISAAHPISLLLQGREAQPSVESRRNVGSATSSTSSQEGPANQISDREHSSTTTQEDTTAAGRGPPAHDKTSSIKDSSLEKSREKDEGCMSSSSTSTDDASTD